MKPLMVVEVIPGTEMPPKKKRVRHINWRPRTIRPLGKNPSQLEVEITKQEEALQKFLTERR